MPFSDQQFLIDMLHESPNAFQYDTGRRLQEAHPERAVLPVDAGLFQPDKYAEAGYCQLTEKAGVFQESQWSWYPHYGPFSHRRNSVLEVTWQSHAILLYRFTVKRRDCDDDLWWIVAASAEIALEFHSAVAEWNSELRDEVLVFDDGQWQKSTELHTSIQSATFENLVLPADLKAEIREDFASFFQSRSEYDRYGVPWKRGVLLFGDPGNGKTHTLKALANTVNASALYVRSFVAEYGTEQSNIARVFQRARATIPCMLIFEDLDSLVNDQNRSYFLNELDGFASNAGIFVVATTNHPERLDPAIVDRPSRFDRKYMFPLPAPDLREEYLRLWGQQVQEELRLTDSGAQAIAAATEGFSFAYLKELWLSSIMAWMKVRDTKPGGMDSVMLDQVAILRKQMASAGEEVVEA